MLHKFFEEGYWFEPKKRGYGAGMPIAWQGWALLGAYLAFLLGVGALIEPTDFAGLAISLSLFIPVTVLVTIVAKRRTRGGWRWRNGEDE